MEMALALMQPEKADKAEKPKQKTVSDYLKAWHIINQSILNRGLIFLTQY